MWAWVLKCWWRKSSCSRFSGLKGWYVREGQSRMVPKQSNDLCAGTTFEVQGDTDGSSVPIAGYYFPDK